MSQLSLFDLDDRPDQARRLTPKLRDLAARGVYLGTSSWKYEAWMGSIYTRRRYSDRGKFSQKRFEAECLEEYAETFSVVGGDFSFYQFPTPDSWKKLFETTPSSLQFGLKVPEEVTVPRWPGHARYGKRADTVNHGFLDSHLFREMFTRPLERYRERVGVLIFEFGTFARSAFSRPADFFHQLDPFLASLPPHFRYSVEIRNEEYLGTEYFNLLRSHNTAHVFNAWTRMPELHEQIDLPGAFTADFSVVRALLKRGRTFEEAKRAFQPYEKIAEPNPGARKAIRRIIGRAWKTRQPAYVFINNRLEGNSPGTIEAIADEVEPV